VNVQILAPGVDAELDDVETIDDPNGGAEGRPEWVPGPPPWVRALLEAIFTSGFPWGTDDFPPAVGAGGEEPGEAGGRPDWVPGPPPWAPGPPDFAGDGDAADTEDDGPPAFVPPAGPPTLPGGPAGPGARP
jgi:hypothetical protein